MSVFGDVMPKNKVVSGRNMVPALGADVLEALVRIAIVEKCAALNAITPLRLVMSIFGNFMRKNKVVSGRNVVAAVGADVLEILVRVTVEKEPRTLNAITP
jgi:hypothetical protein